MAGYNEYICTYLTTEGVQARSVHHAADLPEAMAAHNSAMPDYASAVVKWTGPTGTTFHMHDASLTLDTETN